MDGAEMFALADRFVDLVLEEMCSTDSVTADLSRLVALTGEEDEMSTSVTARTCFLVRPRPTPLTGATGLADAGSTLDVVTTFLE
jgi:hypothetical protein